MANTKRQTKKTAAATVAETTVEAQPSTIKVAKREFDPSQLVPVRNGFQGRLIYVSKRQNGVKTVWDEFGQEEYVELAELISARNTARAFFADNLWIIEDPEILDFLGVSQYYKNSLGLDEFDEVLTMGSDDTENVKAIIAKLSNGQKRTLAYRAKAKIKDGEIDSRKMIETLETALGVELIEK